MKNWCYKKDGLPQEHCRDHVHCRACRSSQETRDKIRLHFEVPDDWDQTCPHGITLKQLNKLPAPWQMLKNLLETIKKAMIYYIHYRRLLAPRSTRKHRLAICRGCDYFDSKHSRCRKCGCCMKAKVLLQVAECKLGLWSK